MAHDAHPTVNPTYYAGSDKVTDAQDTLFVTDAELIRRLGVPYKKAKRVIQALDDKKAGFPQKQKLWGDRRYWPDVVNYLNSTCGLRMGVSRRRDGNA